MSIHENNLKIARFMGMVGIINLNYNASWSWLMPVVEKIGKIMIPVGILGNTWQLDIFWEINNICSYFNIGDNDLIISDSGDSRNGRIEAWKNGDKTPLERTYIAVVAFIDWYNENVINKLK